MKGRGRGDTASSSCSPPTGSSRVQVYHDCQKVPFKMENDSHVRREQLVSSDRVPGSISENQGQKFNTRTESVHEDSALIMDSSSQVCSGPEDNSTEPHESLTESSTITFVDAYTIDESVENHGLQGAGTIYLKEFVLIDDDEDGDMSLREKTVTDLSVMNGKAADLVCGRLLSTSSGSLSEYKEEPSAEEAPPPEEAESSQREKSCCFCSLS